MKALITGASSGIGMEIARQLSDKGIETVLVARRKDRLLELASTLKTKSEIIVADLSKPEEAKKIFSSAPDIDILVNNAGFGVFGKFDETELDSELNLISVNITALHILTKLYLPIFKKKNSGYILNVASLASFFPGPIFASYYASKAYVMRLSGAIYQELKKAGSNVKISCLCPGPVSTEFGGVAGVSLGGKSGFGGIGMNVNKVAKIAIAGMFKGKRIIVPGVLMKCCRFLSKILPERISAKAVMLIQGSKMITKKSDAN